ncbi:hypothetical protein ACO0SA_002546 [Hanseniaspora valbyensis]
MFVPEEYILDYTKCKDNQYPPVTKESHANGFYHISPEYMHSQNKYTNLINGQHYVNVPSYTLESNNKVITNFPIAYKTWGKLSPAKDNVIVVCHALTGSADIQDWWGPLLGPKKSFDYTKYFIICLNSMGSPYGSYSPVSERYHGNENVGDYDFPVVTVRDDVRVHKMVLEQVLGVPSLKAVIGGSMGGMLALEYASLFGESFVKNLVVLASSARHSAWCISWSEAQRQAIYSDPYFKDGLYDLEEQPAQGLAAARMTALLTYRSRNSFEQRFSRREASSEARLKMASTKRPRQQQDQNNKLTNDRLLSSDVEFKQVSTDTKTHSSTSSNNESSSSRREDKLFSAQSYLRYQGLKFVARFDANCYISITQKLDSHDLARPAYPSENPLYEANPDAVLINTLQNFKMPTLVIGIESDGLFTISEQEFLAKHIPNSQFKVVKSMEGHDAFLLEFVEVNGYIKTFLNEGEYQDGYDFEARGDGSLIADNGDDVDIDEDVGVFKEAIQEIKESLAGEAGDVTDW